MLTSLSRKCSTNVVSPSRRTRPSLNRFHSSRHCTQNPRRPPESRRVVQRTPPKSSKELPSLVRSRCSEERSSGTTGSDSSRNDPHGVAEDIRSRTAVPMPRGALPLHLRRFTNPIVLRRSNSIWSATPSRTHHWKITFHFGKELNNARSHRRSTPLDSIFVLRSRGWRSIFAQCRSPDTEQGGTLLRRRRHFDDDDDSIRSLSVKCAGPVNEEQSSGHAHSSRRCPLRSGQPA